MMTSRLRTVLFTAGLCSTLLACGQPEPMGDDGDDAGYAAFRAAVYQEPESGMFIVDGDTPIDEEGLRAFYARLSRKDPPGVRRQGLALYSPDGVDAIWSAADRRNLRYCVSTTFGANHTAVKNAMAAAAAAWQQAADVRFIYRADQDANCTPTNNNVTFDVRPTSGQPYQARAAYPNQVRSKTNVLIDSSAFGNLGVYTLTGLMRHELGHMLGFSHEHTRPEAGTCFENDKWRALTSYDSASVMHYPQCNGSQRGDFSLTDRDRAGARSLYGAPCGVLQSLGQLNLGQSLTSCNRAYTLAMQTDQNLVLYHGGVSLWASGTEQRGASRVTLQSDGNLVVANATNVPLWTSNTGGHPGSYLAVQDDGNMVIYQGPLALWATNTDGM